MADGRTVGYLRLAHNEWDPVAKASRTKVLYSFGREDELQRLHLGTFTGPAGSCCQRTELTATQKKILTALGLPEPRRVFEATPATS
jgi:hypothetical protein